jgi:hypothetical protein
MNALANDQIDRLRRTLADYPDITFGCYTGQTEYTKEKALALFHKLNTDPDTGIEATPLKNEILSREEMKNAPPHILITNYAMLEYLMLRPEDSVFFDGEFAGHWKYIVLDEAHTYTGSTGIEVSMLLRRVVAKLHSPKIQYILTSATLGDENSDAEVVSFAENLCSASFKMADVIRATRIDLAKGVVADRRLPNDFYNTVDQWIEYGYSDEQILKRIDEVFHIKSDTTDLSLFLYDLLLRDETYWKVKTFLSTPKSIDEICEYMDWAQEDLADFVEVASRAVKERTKLFDSRYHLFIRASEGVFVTLSPHKSLWLSQRDKDRYDGQEYKVFEVVTCSQCHAMYIIGKIEEGCLNRRLITNRERSKRLF